MLPVNKYESSSCVKPADFDGDGDTDLFVGIRLYPFLYGVPVNGYILENDGNANFTSVSDKVAPGLKEIGMITDMAWADVDNDRDHDLIIVGDWMPVKIFINNEGTFSDQSEHFGLSGTEGWWHVIIPKDMNGDGYVDFILGNHGLNSRFKASAEKPLTMYVNDFDMNGSVEQIICKYDGNKSYPMVMKDDLVKQIPVLESKYRKFEDYMEQTIGDIFPDEILQRAVILKTRILESCVMINTGNDSFKLILLPKEAQFSPVYAIAAEDFNNDGICDMLLGGNQYRAKPETGIYDASYGLYLKGNTRGSWTAVSSTESGIFTKGELRDMKILNINGKHIVAFVRNNDILQFYQYSPPF
ncbi:MAG: hypothetical protein AMS27_09450 [Bacteroides sp. SM23_62_1]|nr:MAG: hypothetical protein AMS27_09450 [Bacteroides sp. SM23_62_1]